MKLRPGAPRERIESGAGGGNVSRDQCEPVRQCGAAGGCGETDIGEVGRWIAGEIFDVSLREFLQRRSRSCGQDQEVSRAVSW